MKNTFLGTALLTIALVACNNANDKTNTPRQDSSGKQPTTGQAVSTANVSIKGMVAGYLQLKNALSNDNGNDAANAGKAITGALQKFDTASLMPAQKKVFTDVQDDIKEHAEHIGLNAEKIAHQREHFEMLSKDIYDLVKAFPSEQILYKDYCPMYNNGKGAIWVSETKEIKNPYLGKKMPTCGEIKEEIK